MTFSIVLIAALTLLAVQRTDEALTKACMSCICKVEGCQSQVGKCRMDEGSLSCGPYQIKRPYWIDCEKPMGDWQKCTKTMQCSELCVKNYMKKYAQKCKRRGEPTCKDYANIHNRGPFGCRTNSTAYWNKVKRCLPH